MNQDLLDLPWAIQLTFASGFLGYAIAYAGQRDRHRPLEVAFLTLVFGLIGGGIYKMAAPDTAGATIIASLLGVAMSVLVGAFWGWRGRRWTLAVLRRSKVSGHDEAPTAWRSIVERAGETGSISQISVTTHNGVIYECGDTSRFGSAPFGPYLLGPDGSVGLYVTKWTDREGEETPNDTVQDPVWGAEMTFIPASQIRDVELRIPTS